MNKRAVERLDMFRAVRKACTEHAMAWNSSVPMVDAVTALDATLTKLERAIGIQLARLEGVARDKRTKQEALIEQTLRLVRAMYVHAVNSEDAVLQGRMSISRTYLVRKRDAVLTPACEGVLEAALEMLPALAPYGITATETADLQTAIAAYDRVLSSPRNEMIVRKVATKEIDDLVRQSMQALRDKMDRLVSNLQGSAPEFHAMYFNARRVVTSGARMRKAA